MDESVTFCTPNWVAGMVAEAFVAVGLANYMEFTSDAVLVHGGPQAMGLPAQTRA